MKLQLISLEIARLAYEKGFNKNGYREHPPRNYAKVPQVLLQKWLRDEHNIHIVLKPFHDSILNKTTIVADVIKIEGGRTKKSPQFDSYERALECGLKNALHLIPV